MPLVVLPVFEVFVINMPILPGLSLLQFILENSVSILRKLYFF